VHFVQKPFRLARTVFAVEVALPAPDLIASPAENTGEFPPQTLQLQTP
jgi:hypothetical protein